MEESELDARSRQLPRGSRHFIDPRQTSAAAHGEAVQSSAVTDPTAAPTPPPSPTPGPPGAPDPEIPKRFRNYTPGDPAEIRRKLLFGVALLFALLSVYAG